MFSGVVDRPPRHADRSLWSGRLDPRWGALRCGWVWSSLNPRGLHHQHAAVASPPQHASKAARSKAAVKSNSNPVASGKKAAKDASRVKGKGKAKDTRTVDKDASVDDRPSTAVAATAAPIPAILSPSDLEAAQEQNTQSSNARLLLADVLREVLEEASFAVLEEKDSSSSSVADEAEGVTKTVEETKARLVELYNEVIAVHSSTGVHNHILPNDCIRIVTTNFTNS
eukprot:SAG11_NODE_4335_length_1943_cov_8.079176_2_plen_227_part_00